MPCTQAHTTPRSIIHPIGVGSITQDNFPTNDVVCVPTGLQAMRRGWSRTPLVGASLAIARLWLVKARKRRSFWKLVAGIVQNNQADTCAICQCRASQQGRTLAVSLAMDRKADPYAVDRLIAGFEVGRNSGLMKMRKPDLSMDCLVRKRERFWQGLACFT